MTLGEKIKARRKELGMSQVQLARELGLNSSTVLSNWEKNKCKPNTEKMLKICGILSCPIEYFYPTEGNSEDTELSEVEIKLLQKFRMIDEAGQGVVVNVLEYQVSNTQKS